jgi:hypothetical protein
MTKYYSPGPNKDIEFLKLMDALPNVSWKRGKKLKDAGFSDLTVIAVSNPKELSSKTGFSENYSSKIIDAARETTNIGKLGISFLEEEKCRK